MRRGGRRRLVGRGEASFGGGGEARGVHTLDKRMASRDLEASAGRTRKAMAAGKVLRKVLRSSMSTDYACLWVVVADE